MKLSILLGFTLLSRVVVRVRGGDSKLPPSGQQEQGSGAIYLDNRNGNVQDPLGMGAMPIKPFDSPRHHHEKAKLMKRMKRKSGDTSTSHPRNRLLEALRSFSDYRNSNLNELDRWRHLYVSVGKEQAKTLERAVQYKKKLNDIEHLIEHNLKVCEAIVMNALQFYGIDQEELKEYVWENRDADTWNGRISVSQTLKHFVRDWADEGAKERDDAFPCILSTIEKLKSGAASDTPLRVLLPGSGVGRLGHELAKLGGFEVTINEWSMFMNVGYRFIESHSSTQTFSFHPFIDGLSHHRTTKDMLRKVVAPNVTPDPTVLLVEGDFNSAFNDQGGTFDIIVTHFFIDTARNLMAYFDTIKFLLKPGGKWVNLGPLLYGTGPWVQLSLDEIVAIVEDMGFEFEDIGDECGRLTFEDKKIRTTEAEYGFNGKALTKNAYAAQVWVATKPH